MSRYIDADALINQLIWFQRKLHDGDRELTANQCIAFVENAPTVDAVQVVRCRDCEYYVETNGRIGTCELTISGAEDDGFCAWGERENDADMRGEQDN